MNTGNRLHVKNSSKEKLYRILFQSTVVLALFNWVGMYIPSFIRIFLVNEEMASMYPAMLLTILILIDNIKSKTMRRYKYLMYFFLVYFLAYSVIAIHSIVSFRFVEDAVIDNLSGGPKYAYIFIHKLFPSLSEFSAFVISFLIRTEINIIREFFFNWVPIYSMALYFGNCENVGKYLLHGLYIAMGIVTFYSFFEIAYKMGCSWGKKFLETVNPYLAPIGTIHGWYPTLLPEGRLRGVFSEGSFFAYWGCLCLPFFFVEVSKGKWCNAIPVIILVINLFLTQSRSAIVLFFFCVIVFFIFSLVLNSKNKNLLFLVCILIIATLLGLMLVASDGIANKLTKGSAYNLFLNGGKKYINQTISSMTSVSGGSNASRLGLLVSRLRIWLDNPIFGVGSELAGFYISEQLEQYPYRSGEIDLWMQAQSKNGSLSIAYPGLDAYSQSLGYGGVVGLIVDVGPIIIIGFSVLSVFIRCKKNGKLKEGQFVVAVLSSLAAIISFGVSNSFNTNPMYYIVLGLSIGIMIKSRQENVREGEV